MKPPRSLAGELFPLRLFPAAFLLTVLLSQRAAHGDLRTSLSITSPFNNHDHRGARVVPYWDRGGDSVVKQSFLRLTADKPDQRGWVWGRQNVGMDELSFEWKFRVSGASERENGDSLGLFITDQRVYTEGPLFGFTPQFTGLALVVDTARDPEPGGRHRDISLLANNGTRGFGDLQAELVGCNANVRYNEARDDFNILKAGRLRLKYAAEGAVVVEVDSRNTGRWRRCATLTGLDMPPGWLQNARVGIIGVTSSTTNNQDVLGLRLYGNPNEAWEQDKYGDEEEDDFEVLIHHMEHEMFSVHDSLRQTITKLEEAEEAAEARIRNLEENLNRNVMATLEARVASLEVDLQTQVAKSMTRKIDSVYHSLNDRVQGKLSKSLGEAATSWRRPFLVLVCVLLSLCGFAYFKFRELKKQHLL